VEAAGEPEMAFQISAGRFEQVQNTLFLRRHKGLAYH
jgi:hypothetical protein